MSRIKQLTGAIIAPKKPETDAAKPKLEGFRPAPPKDEFKKGPHYACSAPFDPAQIKPPPGGGIFACRAEIPGGGLPIDKPNFTCMTDCFPDMKEKLEGGLDKPTYSCATDCFPDLKEDRPVFACLAEVPVDLDGPADRPTFACLAEVPVDVDGPTDKPVFACKLELPEDPKEPKPPYYACRADPTIVLDPPKPPSIELPPIKPPYYACRADPTIVLDPPKPPTIELPPTKPPYYACRADPTVVDGGGLSTKQLGQLGLGKPSIDEE